MADEVLAILEAAGYQLIPPTSDLHVEYEVSIGATMIARTEDLDTATSAVRALNGDSPVRLTKVTLIMTVIGSV